MRMLQHIHAFQTPRNTHNKKNWILNPQGAVYSKKHESEFNLSLIVRKKYDLNTNGSDRSCII